MDFKEFKSKAKVLVNGDKIRDTYINKFINKEHKLFADYIENMREFSDGFCYTGYLWDFVKDYTRVDYEEIINLIDDSHTVIVLWDIHSVDKILCLDDYWHFGKRDVIKINYAILKENLNNLLEDIYIFDESYQWTIILTHEDDKGKRICIKCGNI